MGADGLPLLEGVEIEYVWGPCDGLLQAVPFLADTIRILMPRPPIRLGLYRRAAITVDGQPVEYYWQGEEG